ncbi:hypothetical protein NFHSH190041_32000 [Shewanella sp. NFH-SH190041]|uniref:chaperone NapD n=1 Tax=Shewanella sp. NFH-SH190041 TaxID=2950245 RepID=UPI0021C27644|nr:chaperone NapD [Shewanella sp. NFH-SH190041]BDM65748.1 hypothetical protein NFHSH190041_32000 [Shewanella sp. NFH-SH190041]
MPVEYHITSLVLHIRPAHTIAVTQQLSQIPGAEIHHQSQDGKLIVTLEADKQSALLQSIEQIQAMPEVLSSSLVFHQVEAITEE